MENKVLENLIQEHCVHLREIVPEFQELWKTQEALDLDSVAKGIWESKEEQRQTIDLLKAKGLPVSPEQESEFAQKLKNMRENPITMKYLKARNNAKKVAGEIGSQMESNIGIDFAPRKGCN